jgi:hypothetical protein
MVISPRMNVTVVLVSVTGKKVLVLTVSSALVLSVLLPLYVVPMLSGNAGGLVHQVDEHQLGSAEAVKFPFQAERVYVLKEIGGASPIASDPVIVHDNVVSGRIACEFCTRIEYIPAMLGRTELSLASDTSYDLTGAKKVTFFAMGAEGDEVITIKAAGKKILDQETGKVTEVKYKTHTKPVMLENTWKKLEVNLGQGNMKDITNAFAIEIKQADNNNSDEPIVLYIKEIVFEKSAASNPVPAEDLPLDEGIEIQQG